MLNEMDAQQPTMPSRPMHLDTKGPNMPEAKPESSMPQRDMNAAGPDSTFGMEVNAVSVGAGMPDRAMHEPPPSANMPEPQMETT